MPVRHSVICCLQKCGLAIPYRLAFSTSVLGELPFRYMGADPSDQAMTPSTARPGFYGRIVENFNGTNTGQQVSTTERLRYAWPSHSPH
jgi:hypothetical protein